MELFKELNEYYITELRDTPDHEFGIGRPANLLIMCGGAMIGTPESELVTGVLHSIKEHNLEHKIYTAAQMREVYPTFRLAEDEIAVYEANAGYLMAELCVEAYIAMARQHGAALLQRGRPAGVQPARRLGGGVEGVGVGGLAATVAVFAVGPRAAFFTLFVCGLPVAPVAQEQTAPGPP